MQFHRSLPSLATHRHSPRLLTFSPLSRTRTLGFDRSNLKDLEHDVIDTTMDTTQQGGLWNPVVVLALHCQDNVNKALKSPIASISATSPDHPLHSFVSALTSVKNGLHPFFRQPNSTTQSSCTCSSSSVSCSSRSISSGLLSKAHDSFLGLSFRGFDFDEKVVQSCSCSGDFNQGFSIAGWNISRREPLRCCCSKVDVKEPGLINVSIMVMSMMLGQRKPVVASRSNCSISKRNDEELQRGIPVLGFLSHHFTKGGSELKCDRKRTRRACSCGQEKQDEGVIRFSLAKFVQFKDEIVRKQTKRLRSSKLGFARLQGESEGATDTVVPDEGKEIVEVEATTSSADSLDKGKSNLGSQMERVKSFAAHSALQPIQVKLPNVDGLLATLGVQELVERMTTSMSKSSSNYPDKKKLTSVQDFFRYTEAEGKRLFDELDRDNDGQVTLEDLEVAMKKRRLPQRYAKEFLKRTRKHWFAKSIGWSEFHMLMEQKEPQMLRAYTTMSLSKSGTLQKSQVLLSLRNARLPATDGNAAAMMNFLNVDTEGSIAYGQFRNFMLLLPPERLGDDPRMVWFEAATVVPMAPPVDIPAGSVLKSALAGGMASALSTSMLHPLDTVKTRVQASTLSFPEVIAKLPEIGIKGMYRGSIPAILGQFTSHGIRTGVLEASKLVLKNMAPNISDLQVQSLSSFTSTVIGTAVRIPCEVLKQRLQAGLYNSVGEAIVGTYQRDGMRGFFRGTGVTLCREVPFYVAGMSIYEEAKKVVQKVLNRELQPWETIAIGGLSGGLAAIATTPFDVMKTRTMTAAPGMPSTMGSIMVAIVKDEGLLALFKGAIPRFFWIAPLGAMNFAGYELAKRAMEDKEKEVQGVGELAKSR